VKVANCVVQGAGDAWYTSQLETFTVVLEKIAVGGEKIVSATPV